MNRILMLAIARLSFLRCREKVMVEEVVLSREFFGSLRLSDVEQIVGRTVRASSFDPEGLLRQAESDEFLSSALGASVHAISDSSYPPQLREIYDPPYAVFVRGRLPDLDSPLIGIVGTRSPTPAGLDAALSLAAECAGAGIPVVSGLALGIDSAAHAGAVREGGRTIAVLGSGVDEIYPRSHKNLAGQILDTDGALVSEYPPRTEPRKYHFPARNRIISGLCRSVVVIEAPERSGALITADYALDQGRDLYVHAVSKASPKGEGSRRLMADGAVVVRRLEDIELDWHLPEASLLTAVDAAPSGRLRPGAHIARTLQKELDL